MGLVAETMIKAEMGQQATHLLIEVIEGNKLKNGGQRHIIIKPELVVRNSCGAVVNNS